MSKVIHLFTFSLILLSLPLIANATNNEEKVNKKGEVLVMDKALFLEKVFDYTDAEEWEIGRASCRERV